VNEAQRLKSLIAELEERLRDLQERLPAHSLKPAMLAALDELDERLAEARQRLAALERDQQA
jgi:hypothetical protein